MPLLRGVPGSQPKRAGVSISFRLKRSPALSFGPFDASELPYMVPMEKRVGLLGLGVGPGLRHLSLSLAVCPGSTGGILGSVGPLCSFQGPL